MVATWGDAVDYQDLVKQAEEAVQGVKDPELKRIAFQKVLEELLGSGGGSRATRPKGKKTTRTASKASERSRSRGPARGPITYLREMIADHFFKKQKAITDVKVELENRGHHIPLTSLSGPLQSLCQRKELRRQRMDGRFVYSNY
jgi:hypothetical protein